MVTWDVDIIKNGYNTNKLGLWEVSNDTIEWHTLLLILLTFLVLKSCKIGQLQGTISQIAPTRTTSPYSKKVRFWVTFHGTRGLRGHNRPHLELSGLQKWLFYTFYYWFYTHNSVVKEILPPGRQQCSSFIKITHPQVKHDPQMPWRQIFP